MTRRIYKAGWPHFAAACARDAHDNHFPSRRGIWQFTGLPVLVIYNNNPYAKHPTLRDEEVTKFRGELALAGIKELGYGTYPGEDDPDGQPGYTFAMVIEAGGDVAARENWCVTVLGRITRESFPELCGAKS